MQFLVSAKWIEGEAEERELTGTRRRDQAAVRADQEGPVVPEREGLPALPEDARPDRGGHPLPGEARRALEQDPPAGHRGRPATSRRAEIEDYYNENEQQFSQPERRDLEVVLTKNQAKAPRPSRRSRAARSGPPRRTCRPTPPPRSRAAACSASPRASRTRSSTRPCSRAQRQGPARSRRRRATTSSRWTKVTKATKQSLDQSKQGIRQLLVSQKQQKELDNFTTDFRNDVARQDRLRRGLRDPRLPQRREPPRRCRRPAGQPKPVASRRRPAALDGSGSARRRQRRGHRDRGRARRGAGGAGGGLAGAEPARGPPLALAAPPRRARRSARWRYRRVERAPAGRAAARQGQQVPPPGRGAPAGRLDGLTPRRRGTSGCAKRCSSWTRITRRLRRECPWDREQDERSIVPTPSRRPTSWPTPRTSVTTRSCSTSSATSCSRSTSSRCCSRSAGRRPGAVARGDREKLVRRHPHVFGEEGAMAGLPTRPRLPR